MIKWSDRKSILFIRTHFDCISSTEGIFCTSTEGGGYNPCLAKIFAIKSPILMILVPQDKYGLLFQLISKTYIALHWFHKKQYITDFPWKYS